MWGTVLSWVHVGDSVKLGLFGNSVNVGLCGGTVLRWAYVGNSVKMGLCGGLC